MEYNLADPVLKGRIQSIVETEKQIDEMMKCAREIMQDLGKEKQISKNKMEDNAVGFKKLITQVENDLNAQMQYLSHVCVGSSHQGSTFGVLQNSLLAQSGLSSLHSELSSILTKIDPPPEEVQQEENDVNLDEEPEEIIAPMTTSSTATSSASDGGASGSAPRSQEDVERRAVQEDVEEMEQ